MASASRTRPSKTGASGSDRARGSPSASTPRKRLAHVHIGQSGWRPKACQGSRIFFRAKCTCASALLAACPKHSLPHAVAHRRAALLVSVAFAVSAPPVFFFLCEESIVGRAMASPCITGCRCRRCSNRIHGYLFLGACGALYTLFFLGSPNSFTPRPLWP